MGVQPHGRQYHQISRPGADLPEIRGLTDREVLGRKPALPQRFHALPLQVFVVGDL